MKRKIMNGLFVCLFVCKAVLAANGDLLKFKADDIIVTDGTQGKTAEWQAILSIDYFFLAATHDEALKLDEKALLKLVNERGTAICQGYGYKESDGGYVENLGMGLVQSLGNEPAQSEIVQQDASGVFRKSAVTFNDKTGESTPPFYVFYKLQCVK